MKQVIETEVMTLDELNPSAKEQARKWYRSITESDSYWSESTLDQAKEIGRLFGFDIKKIYFSGFWCQGDGACFIGDWNSKDVKSLETIEKELSYDKSLIQLGKEFIESAKEFSFSHVGIAHRGHYNHSGCMRFDITLTDEEDNEIIDERFNSFEKSFTESARDFANWIYRTLEKDYEWNQSNECVDENILANEYTFTSTGKRFG